VSESLGYILIVLGIGLAVSALPTWVGGITILAGFCALVSARSNDA
jgi:hypothetical protein